MANARRCRLTVAPQVWLPALKYLRPPPELLPSEWAELNIRIPVGNAIPGLIRFDNAPYQREPLDMSANPDCERITLMWGAQLGKTQLVNCVMGFHVDHRPQSQMMMQPSQGDLQTWLETKLTPLLTANPRLGALFARPRGRTGVNNQRLKSYPGGFLMFAWSGSTRTMRGRSAPKIYCDEVDDYTVTDQGHPISLLWQRAATFGDARLLIVTSTPTVKGASAVETSFELGDGRHFYLPCPHCETFDRLYWSNVEWEGRKTPDGPQRPETAHYICPHCGCMISDGEKVAALRKGEWRADRPFRGHASYKLSELYSTFRRWRDIAQSYVEKLADGDVQTFVNVSLGETWEETGEQAAASVLMARAELYAAEVPLGGVVLTAGVDMQIDRLEVEIVAWGLGEESWSVEYLILHGDPLGVEPWEALDELLDSQWVHESGALLRLSAACLDTGGTAGYPQAAYEYARSTRHRSRLHAIKGVGGWGRPIVGTPSKKKSAARARRVTLYPIGVDETKLVVMRRLALEEYGPGYCHFPTDRAPEWYDQLTAEKLITEKVRGFPVRHWAKIRERNEALDCRVYATAALKLLNPNLRRRAARLAASAAELQALPETVRESNTEEPPTPRADAGKPKRKWKRRRRRT